MVFASSECTTHPGRQRRDQVLTRQVSNLNAASMIMREQQKMQENLHILSLHKQLYASPLHSFLFVQTAARMYCTKRRTGSLELCIKGFRTSRKGCTK
eukprot:scaffold2392_cov166-Ochromonas_danica.AAC.3